MIVVAAAVPVANAEEKSQGATLCAIEFDLKEWSVYYATGRFTEVSDISELYGGRVGWGRHRHQGRHFAHPAWNRDRRETRFWWHQADDQTGDAADSKKEDKAK